ncbi:hypothetical protein ACRRTK_001209 [Alexandromys fortis]
MTMVTESAAGTQDLIPFQTELQTHKEKHQLRVLGPNERLPGFPDLESPEDEAILAVGSPKRVKAKPHPLCCCKHGFTKSVGKHAQSNAEAEEESRGIMKDLQRLQKRAKITETCLEEMWVGNSKGEPGVSPSGHLGAEKPEGLLSSIQATNARPAMLRTRYQCRLNLMGVRSKACENPKPGRATSPLPDFLSVSWDSWIQADKVLQRAVK